MIIIQATPFVTKPPKYEITNETDFSIYLICEQIIRELSIYEQSFLIDITTEIHKKAINTQNFLKAYTYTTLIEISMNDILQKEKFLTDYHSINYLADEAGVTKVDVFRVLIAISNLLRQANSVGVDEIHLASIRVFRKYSPELKKTFYIISEF